ncbi:hypothetical protein LEMLEM_LOCUS16985, partial [Lemmus lemmus]
MTRSCSWLCLFLGMFIFRNQVPGIKPSSQRETHAGMVHFTEIRMQEWCISQRSTCRNGVCHRETHA